MSDATPSAVAPPTSRRNMPQPPLSLTKAAKAVGVSTSTLRRAIEDKKLKAVKSEEGHWRIKVDELMQYKSNEVDTPVDRGAVDMSTQAVAAPSTAPATQAVDIPVAGLSHSAMLKEVFDARVEGLESRVRDQKDTIRNLEDSVESWKTQSKSWQNHADNNLRLLTDEREKLAQQEPDINLSAEGQGGNFWRNIAALFVVVALAGTALYYRDNIVSTVAKFTAADGSTAASIESKNPQG